jgi:hypothetical protein
MIQPVPAKTGVRAAAGWRSRLLVITVLLAVTACTTRSRRAQQSAYQPITVQVENQNFNDVTVYLLWRSDRRRLGSVGGHSRATFTSQWYAPDLVVELDVLAGSRVRSDRVQVNPGEQLYIEIPAQIDRVRVLRR